MDDDVSLRLLLGAIAEQQYRFHLLIKLLIEKKVITSAEFDSKFNEAEKIQFSHDLLEHLVATGLKIAGSSPSSSQKESQSVSGSGGTGAPDPKSGKKS
jgi:hypothetical protein